MCYCGVNSNSYIAQIAEELLLTSVETIMEVPTESVIIPDAVQSGNLRTGIQFAQCALIEGRGRKTSHFLQFTWHNHFAFWYCLRYCLVLPIQ